MKNEQCTISKKKTWHGRKAAGPDGEREEVH